MLIFGVPWLQQAAPAFDFAEQLLHQLNQIAGDDNCQYQLLSACVGFLIPFACFARRSNPKIYAPEVSQIPHCPFWCYIAEDSTTSFMWLPATLPTSA